MDNRQASNRRRLLTVVFLFSPLSQVDVRGVGFPGEQRRPAGGRGPGPQSGRCSEPLVQDARPWRVQVAAAAVAAAALHLRRLPAEVSVPQRDTGQPGSLWRSRCCAADHNNDKKQRQYWQTTTRLPSLSCRSAWGLRIPTQLNVNSSQLIRMSQLYLTVLTRVYTHAHYTHTHRDTNALCIRPVLFTFTLFFIFPFFLICYSSDWSLI